MNKESIISGQDFGLKKALRKTSKINPIGFNLFYNETIYQLKLKYNYLYIPYVHKSLIMKYRPDLLNEILKNIFNFIK